ncbi:MAG TPA: tetratricopeptide repeat protein [Bryobacteraceae bacterium]|jgi:tetratricopeptide (TPR) repeat protein|nr:tetratricopeptide repeat protein [Bryobacteraceae bacterium]
MVDLVASTRKPARVSAVCVLLAGIGAGSFIALRGAGPQASAGGLAPITVDYPAEGSVFPPELTPPTFLWRDAAANASLWTIDVTFPDGSPAIHVKSPGDPMKIGEIDPEAVSANNELPKLTPKQAEAHTWKPDAATWQTIKKHSVTSPATVIITGFRGQGMDQTLSSGHVKIATSADPAGAPIFYRDVPLMPNQGQKGVITPLAPEAIGLIKWRLRYLDEPTSPVVMQKISTCANCHSFSADGKTMGLDIDGPQNDHGLYALIPVAKETQIRTQDVIKWPTVRDPDIPRLRAAFMSQVSPDGRYVLSTIDDADAVNRMTGRTLEDKYYVANFLDYRFLQVFYPTRGTLAWYDRKTNRLERLPGADDPRYVQAGGVWSRDGKFIVFMRAKAQNPYPPAIPLARYANDPNETQVQYDLYRVPFNEGKGGQAEPIRGASANGMSNSFPKISPDGRWVVFVEAKNGMVMRPDGKLHIVPSTGGEARQMNCNTSLMNSWHSFSPNGRWLAFSSKSRSPYTQLYLTHIDANGNDTPPILVDNTTAANRAVNLPEFANIPKGGLEKIDPVANQYYKMENTAVELMTKNEFPQAIAMWRSALTKDPTDGRAHRNLAYALGQTGQPGEALAELRKACDLSPDDPIAFAEFALALAQTGKSDDAIGYYRKSIALDVFNAGVQADLGALLADKGQTAEGLQHLEKAVSLKPQSAAVRYKYASGLADSGRLADAVTQLQKSIEISGGHEWQSYDMLGAIYSKMGRPDDAIQAERQAVGAAPAQDGDLLRNLRARLAGYEQAQQPRR